MKVLPADCIRCNPPNPEDLPLAGKARPICDACTEAARHPWRLAGKGEAPVAGKRPAGTKRRRKSSRKTTVSATALVLLLIATAGCTFHRTTAIEWGSFHRTSNLDVDFHPTLLPGLQIPTLEISPAQSNAEPTES